MKENSPFMPGWPVPVDLFVGRTAQIEEIIRYVKQTASGKQENVFLAGERGIGKSSLAEYIRSWVLKENFLAVHVFLGGVSSLDEIVRRIFEQILKEANTQTWFSSIKSLFGKYVSEIGLFGVTVNFNPQENDLNGLVRNFPEAMSNLIAKIGADKKGLFIVLDDINGISKTPEFADWYKSYVDTAATRYDRFPVFMMPIGLPEIRDELSRLQPSLMRVFRVVEIDKLSDDEVREFFIKAFDRVNATLHQGALRMMVEASSGLPVLMHEIGDAVYLRSGSTEIGTIDAAGGIVDAAERIGKKYLDPKVYRTIRSERYRSILRKLGKHTDDCFKKTDIERLLNEQEQRVFHNFLRKMTGLGIIVGDEEGGRGAYRYVNKIYPIYISLESELFREKHTH